MDNHLITCVLKVHWSINLNVFFYSYNTSIGLVVISMLRFYKLVE